MPKITVSWREVTQKVATFEATFEVDNIKEPMFANLERYLQVYATENNRIHCSSLVPVREILHIEEHDA